MRVPKHCPRDHACLASWMESVSTQNAGVRAGEEREEKGVRRGEGDERDLKIEVGNAREAEKKEAEMRRFKKTCYCSRRFN